MCYGLHVGLRKTYVLLYKKLPVPLRREVGGGFKTGNTGTPVADSC